MVTFLVKRTLGHDFRTIELIPAGRGSNSNSKIAGSTPAAPDYEERANYSTWDVANVHSLADSDFHGHRPAV